MTRSTDDVTVPRVLLSEAAGLLDCEGYGPISSSLNALLAAPPPVPAPTPDELAAVGRLREEVTKARRRRDEWKAKAEGYDTIRRALREKVGSPGPPHLSRFLWAGIAADERKRADDAEAEIERLKGKNLACWCRLDQDCHADVLLDLANRTEGDGG